jgi:hypothetical protein
MDLRFQHQTLGVYEQMTLSAFHLLSAVVTALITSYASALDLPWLSTTPALG